MRNAARYRAVQWCALWILVPFLAACGGNGGGGTPAMVPPTVTLDAVPATANRTVTLSATASANTGQTITLVDFLVDGASIGTDSQAPYEIAWDTSTVADGDHNVLARVTDSQSLTADSAPASVTVQNNLAIDLALSPDQEFPRPTSTASGAGQLAVNLVSGAMSGQFTAADVTLTMAHVHDAYAGDAGPVLIPFVEDSANPGTWALPGDAMLTAPQVDALLAGRLYVNGHSAAYPAGEIRAQIVPAGIEVHFAAMTGDQEASPVTTTALGLAGVTLNRTAGTATVHLLSDGVDDATMAHIHVGAAGVAGPVLFPLTQDVGDFGHWFVEGQAVTTENLQDFDDNNWYVNVHTPANPDGEIRGQFAPNPVSTPAATLTLLQSSIFSPTCAGCHNGVGAALPGSMNLASAAASFAALVNVASTEQPAVLRVAPNDPDASYLVRKLEGGLGITGDRMPQGGPFLDQATIDQVRAWISAGAMNN